MFVNWDVLAHTVSGTITALIGFLVILFWDKIKNYNLDAAFIGIFIVFFGCVFEYFWEIWEFFVDTFFGGSAAGLMQANNADTMSDMIFVLIASLIVGIGCYYYIKHYGKETIFREMVKAAHTQKNSTCEIPFRLFYDPFQDCRLLKTGYYSGTHWNL